MSQGHLNDKVVSLNINRFPTLGASQVKAVDTNHLAATDGFVSCWGGNMVVYSDQSITPSTVVCQTSVGSGTPALVVPILKNYYWKVTGASNILWYPLS